MKASRNLARPNLPNLTLSAGAMKNNTRCGGAWEDRSILQYMKRKLPATFVFTLRLLVYLHFLLLSYELSSTSVGRNILFLEHVGSCDGRRIVHMQSTFLDTNRRKRKRQKVEQHLRESVGHKESVFVLPESVSRVSQAGSLVGACS